MLAKLGQRCTASVEFGSGRDVIVGEFPQGATVSTDKQLSRLGAYIASRRVALGYKHRKHFAHALGITDRTLDDIESGVRRARIGTYAQIENVLEWKPSSIAAILDGGEPTEIQKQPTQPPPSQSRFADVPTAEIIGLIRELFAELRFRIPEVES